jgi:hypothetical protein
VTWRGDVIHVGRAISFRIVDPNLERCEGPAGSASAKMYRRGKSLRRDPTIKCWAAQSSYAKHISKSKEGRGHRRAFGNAGMLARRVARAFVGDFDHHSTGPRAGPEKCLRTRGPPERSLEQGPCRCRCLPIHGSTSLRSHPMGRPWNSCFLGNLPMIERAVRIQRWRRVSRATSCDVRISFHAGNRSFTQRDKSTSAGVTAAWPSVRRKSLSVYTARPAREVWFRSLRDELSLRRQYELPRERRNDEYHRIFGVTPREEVRAYSDLPLKNSRE